MELLRSVQALGLAGGVQQHRQYLSDRETAAWPLGGI